MGEVLQLGQNVRGMGSLEIGMRLAGKSVYLQLGQMGQEGEPRVGE